MKIVALILAIGILIRHNTSFVLSDWTGYSPQGIFYILGGFWELTLAVVIFGFLMTSKRTPWRDVAMFGCMVMAVEGPMSSTCRILLKDHSTVPPRTWLCDHISGIPLGVTLIATYTLILFWLLIRTRSKNNAERAS